MERLSKFFDVCRDGVMGPTLDNDEVSGANAILEACESLPLAWAAYALATAWHETAHTMQPVKEYGGNRYFWRMYDIQGQRPYKARELGNFEPGDGVKYPGRGYVQVTGKSNYIKADLKLSAAGLIESGELMANPELAMRPDISAHILRHGMREGWFTGKRFQTYLPTAGEAGEVQFQNARWIINGVDDAPLIAKYGLQFQTALKAGGWPT